VGAGVFRVSQTISSIFPYPTLILLCWIVGGIISLAGAVAYGNLARRFPTAGGDYSFLKAAFPDLLAFLFAWTKVFIVQPASIAGIALIFAAYMNTLFAEPFLSNQAIAAIGITLLALINIGGVQQSVFLQNTMTFIKVGCISFIAITAFILSPDNITNLQPIFPAGLDLPFFQALGMVFLFVLWTYGGWNEGVFLGDEVKNVKRELPRGLIGGAIAITTVYVIINVAYHLHLPVSVLGESKSPFSLLAETLFGVSPGKWVAVLIAIACLSSLNSFVLTGGRVAYAMALDHRAFSYFGRIHPRFRTPVPGIGITALLSIVMALTGTFERLVAFGGIIVWFFFFWVMVALGKFLIQDQKRGEKGSGIVWASLFIYASVALWLTLNTLITAPFESACGILITLVGIPLFFLRRKPS